MNSYQYLNNKETRLLIFLFLFSFVVRVPVVLIYGDTALEHEWKVLVTNLVDYGKLSLSYRGPFFIKFDDFFVPSVLMPPLYVFYLYFFKLFNFHEEIYILIILFSQILLSSFSVIIFYKINKFFFSNRISLIGCLIFSFFPLHIYACGQISSIILQSFLTITFFYFFLKISKKKNFYNIGFFSLAAGLLILLRGEFIALFILTILYMLIFLKIRTKSILIILILTIFVISPYLIRNIIVLDTITITKSLGFNLWRGNHPNTSVDGNSNYEYDDDLKIQINQIEKNKYYEIEVDKVFLNKSLENIKNDPMKYFHFYIKKFLSFIFIDIKSAHPIYYHPLNYFPALLIGITSVLGILKADKKSYLINFFILFFIAQVSIVSVFFILPRYKLAIIALQIFFSNILFNYMANFFKKK